MSENLTNLQNQESDEQLQILKDRRVELAAGLNALDEELLKIKKIEKAFKNVRLVQDLLGNYGSIENFVETKKSLSEDMAKLDKYFDSLPEEDK